MSKYAGENRPAKETSFSIRTRQTSSTSHALTHQSAENEMGDSKASTSISKPASLNINYLRIDSYESLMHIQDAQRIFGEYSKPIDLTAGFNFSKIDVIQPKMKISHPGDVYEQEANMIAEQVMSVSAESSIMTPLSAYEEKIDRKCAACEMKEEDEEKILDISRKHSRSVNQEATDEITKEISDVRSSSGSAIDSSTKDFMESRLGYDFSNVRIHVDRRSAESARAIGALAYTAGNDIVFGAGQYEPNTPAGRSLIVHELVHTIQQRAVKNPSIQRQTAREEACETRYSRATNFGELVSLIRAAEANLISCGFASTEDRVHVLRGVYYGTTWSMDYQVEKSNVRNVGFQTYTASRTPADPRACLRCGLFEALRGSAEVSDGSRRIDFGHLMIGLDARRSIIARNVRIPTQGGTGLEISTWLGDLGGGAGMLAYLRVTNPSTPAMSVFRGSDFGGAINLEGDVAGYLVARDTTMIDAPSAPVFSTGSIADALDAYLAPSGSRTEWDSRCANFLRMLGGQLDNSGRLMNKSTVISGLSGQIDSFGSWYLVNRMRQQNRLSLQTLRDASRHIVGVSNEVAQIFVDALDYCSGNPGSGLRARGAGPAPSPPGEESTVLSALIRGSEFMEGAGREGSNLYNRAREWWNNF